MPLTYTNRKGTTYTLYRQTAVDGKPRYLFARNPVGEPLAAMPPGFRVSESPNGVVSVARDRPALLRPDEIAAVEAEIARHPKPHHYRVASKGKRIEVYARIGPDAVDVYREMAAAGFLPPGREQDMRELDERFAQFTPTLCFTLIDPDRRWFGAEERSRWAGIDEWLELGQEGEIAALAHAIIPSLDGGFLPGYTTVQPGITTRPPATPGKGGRAMPTKKRAKSQPTSVHQLKITLLHLSPPVWRRIAVPSDMPLGALHYVLQLAMGWTDSHLHDFRVGRTTYGDPEMLQELGDADEWEAPLADVAPRTGNRLRYTYDFGDNWEHDILIEQIGPPEPELAYPVCLAGERACPPDDCGGVWGYADLLEALADPKHPEHEWLMEWAGGPIDPEAFDRDEVNTQLARLP